MKRKLTQAVAGGAAVLAIGIGALAVSGADTSSTAAAGGWGGGPPGMAPGDGPRGEAVAGARARRVEEAVLAEHPGSVERVMEGRDGGYLALVEQEAGARLLVRLSDDLEVLDALEAGPGGGPPPGATPPDGTAPAPDGTAPPS